MTVTLADISAITDVLTQFTNEIDSLPVEEALRFAKVIAETQAAAKLAQEFLNTRALNLIEKRPVVVDGAVIARKADKKWRPDQGKIRRQVAKRAVYDLQTGEKVETMEDAAENAVTLMYELFVAPSAFPKQGGLKALGLTNLDVGVQEITGYSLKTMEIESDDD